METLAACCLQADRALDRDSEGFDLDGWVTNHGELRIRGCYGDHIGSLLKGC